MSELFIVTWDYRPNGLTTSSSRLAMMAIIGMLWKSPEDQWEEIIKAGLGVMLFKSGDKKSLENYRCIVLLSMLSRLLGKIVARRISKYAEEQGFFSRFQFGNRKYRSVCDALFVVRMVLELAAETAHCQGDTEDAGDKLAVVLFDIRKAFPSVDRDAAFLLLGRLGFPESMLQILRSLHNGTVYEILSKQGLSASYKLDRGFREGCCSSPGLYSVYHDTVMKQFRKQALQLLRTRNLQTVTLRHVWGRPFHKRVYKPHKHYGEEDALKLLDITFADDTSLLCRERARPLLEEQLQSTLSAWGEEIKASKTKRLLVCSEVPAVDFKQSARLLGGWLSHTGLHEKDDKVRLAAARRVWSKLHRQLPRYCLPDRVVGRLIEAAVIRSLTFGVETRAVGHRTLQEWQVFLNGVIRGALHVRLSRMHENQQTAVDLLRRLGLASIAMYVTRSQLRFLGHVARLPPGRVEPMVLFGWLKQEASRPAKPKYAATRAQLWRRICEIMAFTEVPKSDWRHQWYRVAAQDDGAEWEKLIARWWSEQYKDLGRDTWEARHKDAAREGRRAAAAERAREELGVIMQHDGRYKCGFAGCNKLGSLRTMRTHVVACGSLTVEQRQAQTDVRESTAARQSDPSNRRRAAPRPVLTHSLTRRRVSSKQRPDAMGPCTSVNCRNFDPVQCLADFKARTRNTRPMRLTDLPVPAVPSDWPALVCPFCTKPQTDKTSFNRHIRACKYLPYLDWLWRVRTTQQDAVGGQFPCEHCGTRFLHAKAAGRHSVVCKERRQLFQLPVSLRQWQDD